MKQLVIFNEWKHNGKQEIGRIDLDVSLDKQWKEILHSYLVNDFLKDFDLTYEEKYWDEVLKSIPEVKEKDLSQYDGKFILTMKELELCLSNPEYTFGEYGTFNAGYLYPISITTQIVEKKEVLKLSQLK